MVDDRAGVVVVDRPAAADAVAGVRVVDAVVVAAARGVADVRDVVMVAVRGVAAVREVVPDGTRVPAAEATGIREEVVAAVLGVVAPAGCVVRRLAAADGVAVAAAVRAVDVRPLLGVLVIVDVAERLDVTPRAPGRLDVPAAAAVLLVVADARLPAAWAVRPLADVAAVFAVPRLAPGRGDAVLLAGLVGEATSGTSSFCAAT